MLVAYCCPLFVFAIWTDFIPDCPLLLLLLLLFIATWCYLAAASWYFPVYLARTG